MKGSSCKTTFQKEYNEQSKKVVLLCPFINVMSCLVVGAGAGAAAAGAGGATAVALLI